MSSDQPLLCAMQFYLQPLSKDYTDAIPLYDLNSMFHNVEAILELTKRLFNKLKDCFFQPVQEQRVGQLFLQMVCPGTGSLLDCIAASKPRQLISQYCCMQ
jgi:hypothetical protein